MPIISRQKMPSAMIVADAAASAVYQAPRRRLHSSISSRRPARGRRRYLVCFTGRGMPSRSVVGRCRSREWSSAGAAGRAMTITGDAMPGLGRRVAGALFMPRHLTGRVVMMARLGRDWFRWAAMPDTLSAVRELMRFSDGGRCRRFPLSTRGRCLRRTTNRRVVLDFRRPL